MDWKRFTIWIGLSYLWTYMFLSLGVKPSFWLAFFVVVALGFVIGLIEGDWKKK